MNSKNKGSAQPRPLVAAISGTKTVRFTGGVAGAINIQIADLQDLFMNTPTATTGYRLFDAIRMKKIEIWASAAAAGNNAVQVEEISSSTSFLQSSKSRVVQDMVVGTSRAAHVVWKPTPGTIQANWFGANLSASVNLLTITVPVNSVLDLTFDFTLADGNAAPTAVTSAVAGATAGQIYCRPFGVSTSSTFFVPVGIASK